MNQLPSGKHGGQVEKVSIKAIFCGKYRVFAAFLICAAIVIAGFAASSIWKGTDSGKQFFSKISGLWSKDPEPSTNDPVTPPSTSESPLQNEDQTPPQENVIPDGAIPVVSMDLSCLSKGDSYYLNETPYNPNVEELVAKKLNFATDSEQSFAPLVLIVHTHTAESYLDEGISYIEKELDEVTFSNDTNKNIIEVGRVLAEHLNKRGVSTLHCTVMHTGNGMSLQGSYARAETTIASYLSQYPSIQLVIDLHRDAVLTENREYVKTDLPDDDDTLAQIMAVVGTDANGTDHERWQENLALALQLRCALNEADRGIARPVYLRSSSYNQELAPYSLLLEIGTGANSLEQAKRTAQRVGDALVKIIDS